MSLLFTGSDPFSWKCLFLTCIATFYNLLQQLLSLEGMLLSLKQQQSVMYRNAILDNSLEK
jgi:hypothetical protein